MICSFDFQLTTVQYLNLCLTTTMTRSVVISCKVLKGKALNYHHSFKQNGKQNRVHMWYIAALTLLI